MGNTCGLNFDGLRFAIAHFNFIAQRITCYRFFGVPRKSGYMHKNVIAAGIGLYQEGTSSAGFLNLYTDLVFAP